MENHKRKNTTTIAVEREVLNSLHRLANDKNVDLKTYMRLVVSFIEKTGQDVSENVSVVQELRKVKEQFISFQRNFEKTKLQPLLDSLSQLYASLSVPSKENEQVFNFLSERFLPLQEKFEKIIQERLAELEQASNTIAVEKQKQEKILQYILQKEKKLKEREVVLQKLKETLIETAEGINHRGFAEFVKKSFESIETGY